MASTGPRTRNGLVGRDLGLCRKLTLTLTLTLTLKLGGGLRPFWDRGPGILTPVAMRIAQSRRYAVIPQCQPRTVPVLSCIITYSLFGSPLYLEASLPELLPVPTLTLALSMYSRISPLRITRGR